MAMKSTEALSGTFGKLYENGEWLMNVYGVELGGEINYEDVRRSGTRAKGKKAMDYDLTGTIQSYHVNNNFIKRIAQILDDKQSAFVTELIVEIDDPENPVMGAEKIRVKNVQFTNLPILSYEHGSLVEQELQFVYEGFEYIAV